MFTEDASIRGIVSSNVAGVEAVLSPAPTPSDTLIMHARAVLAVPSCVRLAQP